MKKTFEKKDMYAIINNMIMEKFQNGKSFLYSRVPNNFQTLTV